MSAEPHPAEADVHCVVTVIEQLQYLAARGFQDITLSYNNPNGLYRAELDERGQVFVYLVTPKASAEWDDRERRTLIYQAASVDWPPPRQHDPDAEMPF